MKNAQTILDNAKTELIDLICTLMRKIDGYRESGTKRLMTAVGFEVVFYDEDFENYEELPMVRIPYGDLEGNKERKRINELLLNEDGTLEICACGTVRVIDPMDLTAEELMSISRFLNEYWETLPDARE